MRSAKHLRARWQQVVKILGVVLTLLIPSVAQADHEAAKELFRAGRAAYERGDFRAAAASFEQAARAEPHPQAWYAAADAWATADAADRAVYAFEQALQSAGGPGKRRAEIERRMAVLQRKLGLVEVEGPAGTVVSVAHVSRAAVPARIYVEPGEHEVTLVEPAYAAATRSVRVAAGETGVVTFEYEPRSTKPEPAPTPTRPPVPGPRGSDEPQETSAAPAIAGWVTMGLGVATAVAAAILTSQALDARDTWEADRRDTALLDRAESLRTGMVVTWVAAGVLTAAGAIVLVVDVATDDPDGDAQATPPVSLHLSPLGASIQGAF